MKTQNISPFYMTNDPSNEDKDVSGSSVGKDQNIYSVDETESQEDYDAETIFPGFYMKLAGVIMPSSRSILDYPDCLYWIPWIFWRFLVIALIIISTFNMFYFLDAFEFVSYIPVVLSYMTSLVAYWELPAIISEIRHEKILTKKAVTYGTRVATSYGFVLIILTISSIIVRLVSAGIGPGYELDFFVILGNVPVLMASLYCLSIDILSCQKVVLKLKKMAELNDLTYRLYDDARIMVAAKSKRWTVTLVSLTLASCFNLVAMFYLLFVRKGDKNSDEDLFLSAIYCKEAVLLIIIIVLLKLVNDASDTLTTALHIATWRTCTAETKQQNQDILLSIVVRSPHITASDSSWKYLTMPYQGGPISFRLWGQHVNSIWLIATSATIFITFVSNIIQTFI
jgi:hypothetical protein